jgi:hypothetical protein
MRKQFAQPFLHCRIPTLRDPTRRFRAIVIPVHRLELFVRSPLKLRLIQKILWHVDDLRIERRILNLDEQPFSIFLQKISRHLNSREIILPLCRFQLSPGEFELRSLESACFEERFLVNPFVIAIEENIMMKIRGQSVAREKYHEQEVPF